MTKNEIKSRMASYVENIIKSSKVEYHIDRKYYAFSFYLFVKRLEPAKYDIPLSVFIDKDISDLEFTLSIYFTIISAGISIFLSGLLSSSNIKLSVEEKNKLCHDAVFGKPRQVKEMFKLAAYFVDNCDITAYAISA